MTIGSGRWPLDGEAGGSDQRLMRDRTLIRYSLGQFCIMWTRSLTVGL